MINLRLGTMLAILAVLLACTEKMLASPPSSGALVPLSVQDSQAMRSELSNSELACLGDDPEGLAQAFAGSGSSPMEAQAKVIQCLDDEHLARIFVAGFLPDPAPLSLESSACVRAAFQVIDPREVMTELIEGEHVRALASTERALIVTLTCLNDEEWEVDDREIAMSLEERKQLQCIMEMLGGSGEMAVAMQAAWEGGSTDMDRAMKDCGLVVWSPTG